VSFIAELYMPWYHDQEFVAEITALAEVGGVSKGFVFLMNFLYDLMATASCTSILATNTDGVMMHARNLDYNF